MQGPFLLGNVASALAVGLLLSACAEPRWAHDAVNTVDIGLWLLTGTGVQYKLINAGLSVDSAAASAGDQPFTLYQRYCALSNIAETDPWCQGKAHATRALVVISLISAVTSFIFSFMAALGIRTPTWNGEGKVTTMVKPALYSLLSFVTLLPAVIEWQQMVNLYDTACRESMKVTKFACITSGPAHKTAMAAVPFTLVSFVLWRLTNSYQEAKRDNRITDAFTLAAKTDNVDEILAAIANKVDMNALGSDGRNALHWACTLNRASICHVLLKKGANISMKDRDGWTPLHWASRVGGLDIVRLLAKYGADINVKDRWGTTPLMLTVVGESRAAAETLIELGADIDARNVFGQTALMICMEAGSRLHQLGMTFINAGASLSLQDAQGMTVIHYAATYGNANLLLNILQQSDGALVDKRNAFGETATEVAGIHGQIKIAEFIKSWKEGNPVLPEDDDATDDDSEGSNGASNTTNVDSDDE